MRKLFLLLVLAVVMMSNVVLGEEVVAYVGTPYTISTACIRNSQMRGAEFSTSATITIWRSDGTLYLPKTSEVSSGNGTFSYILPIFTEVGTFNTRETCDFGGILADGSTTIHVEKPGFGNLQVIAQGVSQANINTTITSEWLLLLPNSTGAANSSIVVTGGVCGVLGTTVAPAVVVENDLMTASFIADPIYGFAEGQNYPVMCNISLSAGLKVNGIKSFVYVNKEASLWQSILQLLGLAQLTNEIVNQTLDISNQTLVIVQNLNTTGGQTGAQIYEQLPKVYVAQNSLYPGQVESVVALAMLGSKEVPNATCLMTIYENNHTPLVDGELMSFVSNQYVYNWSVPEFANGYYATKVNCTGGAFGTAVVGDFREIFVNGQIIMQNIG